MLNSLLEIVKDKKVLIFGFLKEGQSTYKILKNLNACASITITDPSFDKDDKNIISYQKALKTLNDYDVVFKDEFKPLLNPDDHDCFITCQADIFLKAFRDDVITIAGSRGKTTTATLIKEMLKDECLYKEDTCPFDLLSDFNADGVTVIEINDNQLKYLHNNATISVVLNCFPELAFNYESVKAYKEAYRNTYKYQVKGDNLICNLDFYERKIPSTISVIGTRRMPFKDLAKIDTRLFGYHNMFNVSAVYEISYILGIEKEVFAKTLASYMPLKAHGEFLGSALQINFYDDSYSKYICDTMRSIEYIPDLDTIIIGGNEDKDPGDLIKALYHYKVGNVCLFGSFGKEIYEQMLDNKRKINVYYSDDCEASIDKAIDVCKKGKSLVLSPACRLSESIRNKYRDLVNRL